MRIPQSTAAVLLLGPRRDMRMRIRMRMRMRMCMPACSREA